MNNADDEQIDTTFLETSHEWKKACS